MTMVWFEDEHGRQYGFKLDNLIHMHGPNVDGGQTFVQFSGDASMCYNVKVSVIKDAILDVTQAIDTGIENSEVEDIPEWELNSDIYQAFVDECCDIGEGYKIKAQGPNCQDFSDLEITYRDWRHANMKRFPITRWDEGMFSDLRNWLNKRYEVTRTVGSHTTFIGLKLKDKVIEDEDKPIDYDISSGEKPMVYGNIAGYEPPTIDVNANVYNSFYSDMPKSPIESSFVYTVDGVPFDSHDEYPPTREGSVCRFIDDRCFVSNHPADVTSAQELYEAYCVMPNKVAMTKRTFGCLMTSYGHCENSGFVKRKIGGKIHYVGIRLKEQ